MSGFEEEVNLLNYQELWVQYTASLISEGTGKDRDTCISGVRWASRWRDDFAELKNNNPSTENKEEIIQLIEQAMISSREKCDSLVCYPSGAPTLTTIMAAHVAFCMSFGDEEDEVSVLLNLPIRQY